MTETVYEPFHCVKQREQYVITTAFDGENELYWSRSARGFTSDNLLGVFSGEISFADPFDGKRCYFHILRGNNHYVTATRLLDVEGSQHMRDIGGYITEDGRAVRWGMVYRSGFLRDLTEKGKAQFASLGIDRGFDFRCSAECDMIPDPELDGFTIVQAPAMLTPEGKEKNFDLRFLLKFDMERIRAMGTVSDGYSLMAYNNPGFKMVFDALRSDGGAVLYHCTAGKDRTGMMSAFILLSLGVPMETVKYDYMLTNEFRKNDIARLHEQFSPMINGDPEKEELFKASTTVSLDYFNITLDRIRERYPSVEAYLEGEYGIDASAREELKARLLCDVDMDS